MRLCYSVLLAMSLLVITSGSLLLSGCGQKGALYLPPATSNPETSNKAASNTVAADKPEATTSETNKKKSQ